MHTPRILLGSRHFKLPKSVLPAIEKEHSLISLHIKKTTSSAAARFNGISYWK
jgi:hypothetical protein